MHKLKKKKKKKTNKKQSNAKVLFKRNAIMF